MTASSVVSHVAPATLALLLGLYLGAAVTRARTAGWPVTTVSLLVSAYALAALVVVAVTLALVATL